MGYKTIIYEKKDRVGTITLNRPKSMNALNGDVLRELSDVLDTIGADDEVKVVIITGGNEKFFAAGADITEVEALQTPADAHVFVTKTQAAINKIEDLEKPVIAAINGGLCGSLVCSVGIFGNEL